jgi:Outer membrane protein
MKKILFALTVIFVSAIQGTSQITLDYCLDRASENYPLIKKYNLVEQTADIQLSDINRGWLPRIGVYTQATVQNVVPEFPDMLRDVLQHAGAEIRGLGHIQYKAGVDISQTIWDGGSSKASRQIERAAAAESKAALDVEMYALREKVMNLFFGVLLIDRQIAQTENNINLLRANLKLMESMLKGGVAMQSDVDMVEAQLLTASQQLTAARSSSLNYRKLLSLYIGENIEGKTFEKPAAAIPSDLKSDRPELTLFDARRLLTAARNSAVEASVRPRIGLFAQAYYGYPGINYFESMMNRNLSFNVVGGIKVSWNLDSFYTRKNSRRRLDLSEESTETDREVFLFNTALQTSSQSEAIDRLKKVMLDDEKIVSLRAAVRRAAESQLENGVIDATALLAKITDENQARLTASYHEIELLQNIYQLKHTLNR